MLNSLNEPTRCRNHSRATKIGQRTWKRNALCSNGVPCRSRIRKRINPASPSVISTSRRPKPWSRTGIDASGNTSGMTATWPSVEGAYVGTGGFSYPSWRPGFYPPDANPRDFLRLYAERLPSVELNTVFYRLPAEDQFARWAAQTPPGFRFAVKMTRTITHFGRLER